MREVIKGSEQYVHIGNVYVPFRRSRLGNRRIFNFAFLHAATGSLSAADFEGQMVPSEKMVRRNLREAQFFQFLSGRIPQKRIKTISSNYDAMTL